MPTKQPPKQQAPANTSKQQAPNAPKKQAPAAKGNANNSKPAVPEHEVKQNSAASATMALEAGKKAWELRQAAHGAGDADARERMIFPCVGLIQSLTR